MAKEKIDEELKEQLELRFLLAQCAKDDPLTETIMLEKLFDLYKEKGLKIPKKINDYFKIEFTKLKKEYNIKKQQLEQ